jgi:hypothetical protein
MREGHAANESAETCAGHDVQCWYPGFERPRDAAQGRQQLESARGNVQRVGRTATGMNMVVLRGRGPAG